MNKIKTLMLNLSKSSPLLLWGMVAYAGSLLCYFTFKVFDGSADFISAFGSIVSASATIFAALVAIILFNDWKDPHKATFYSNECKTIINHYKKLLILTRKLSSKEFEISKIIYTDNGIKLKQPTFLSTGDKEKLKELYIEVDSDIQKLFNELDQISSELIMLAYLTEDNNYMINSINLEDSLTRSYLTTLEENDSLMPYKKYHELCKANKNQFLITKGVELIRNIKLLGKI